MSKIKVAMPGADLIMRKGTAVPSVSDVLSSAPAAPAAPPPPPAPVQAEPEPPPIPVPHRTERTVALTLRVSETDFQRLKTLQARSRLSTQAVLMIGLEHVLEKNGL
ncbi:MAG TPA: hypothetical protein VHL31_01155 [Geminicoccus sp.]|uniref:hypothetical protein n=1 Tax=Geminicoccus sp. TaxID=2024832 RepID=UPI002E34BD80|nr:hypothetical protein [Geminicoccus sp.]HEX2524897.1 hypothetical protein [Geminicoccus sp.]